MQFRSLIIAVLVAIALDVGGTYGQESSDEIGLDAQLLNGIIEKKDSSNESAKRPILTKGWPDLWMKSMDRNDPRVQTVLGRVDMTIERIEKMFRVMEQQAADMRIHLQEVLKMGDGVLNKIPLRPNFPTVTAQETKNYLKGKRRVNIDSSYGSKVHQRPYQKPQDKSTHGGKKTRMETDNMYL